MSWHYEIASLRAENERMKAQVEGYKLELGAVSNILDSYGFAGVKAEHDKAYLLGQKLEQAERELKKEQYRRHDLEFKLQEERKQSEAQARARRVAERERDEARQKFDAALLALRRAEGLLDCCSTDPRWAGAPCEQERCPDCLVCDDIEALRARDGK